MSEIPKSTLRLAQSTAKDSSASVAYGDNGPIPLARVATPPLPKLPARASTPPPRPPAKVDEATLLSVSVLTLSKELRLSVAHVGRVIVKYHPGRRHLVLTPLQWTVLQTFEAGRTVPAALKHLLHNGGCIPLCEFYELILKACDQGILQTPGYPLPARVVHAPWRFSLPGKLLRPLAALLIFASLLLLLIYPLQVPAHWLWWLPGWALLCVAKSAGTALAAAVVNATDGDLYHPRFITRSLFPRFVIDHDDALLGGRQVEVNIALAQIVPFSSLATLATIWAPSLALPLFLGLLWSLAPIRRNPGYLLLRAAQHAPRTSTAEDFRFKPNQTLLHRIRQHLEPTELRFLFLRVGYAVPWFLLLVVTWAAITRFDFEQAWETHLAHRVVMIAWWTLAGLFGLALVGGVILALAVAIETRRIRQTKRQQQDARELASMRRPAPDLAGLVAFLGETHPFINLPLKRRELIAENIRQTPFAAGETVIAAGDKLTRLYLVYAGSVRITTAGTSRSDIVYPAGSIVGERVLFEGGQQAAAVIGVVPGILVSVNREAYEELIAPFVPRHKIEDAIQKVSFLRRIALSRHWPAHLLDSFSRRAVVHSFGYSSVILETGRENLWFYVLQEGELRVMRNGRKVARLRPGDFFGEISVLQNSLTTADIVGHVPGRYLAIPRQDFLVFLTQDHEIAMQFEAIASRRLGRPVFPL